MQTFLSALNDFWHLLTNPTPQQEKVMGEGRPFLISLTLILSSATVLVIYNSPELHRPLPLAALLLTMTLHIGLHWLSGFSAASPQWSVAYLTGQGLLGLAVIFISSAPELALAIFAAMIGETIGTFGGSRLAWIAVTLFLALTPLSYFLIGGASTFANWISPTISTMVILIIFMALFRRQLAVSQRAQKLADQLESANRQLAAYAAEVEELTLTAERERMARELHDTLAQGVAGLVLQLEAADANLEAGRTERAKGILQQAMARARSTLAEARAVIDDLRLRDDQGGLRERLHQLAQSVTAEAALPCTVEAEPGNWERRLDLDQVEQVERMVTEALTNIRRHAQASKAQIRLGVDGDELTLTIQDDGIGFDPQQAPQSGHYGLRGLQERAHLLGGSCQIESRPGAGTAIAIRLPLKSRPLPPPQLKE